MSQPYKSGLIAILLIACNSLSAQVKPGGPGLPPVASPSLPAAYTQIVNKYIRTWIPKIPVTDPQYFTTNTPVSQTEIKNTYLDGLGRPIQHVIKGITPGGNDIVQMLSYDAMDRWQYKYLPYPSTDKTGAFKLTPYIEQKAFYEDVAKNPGVIGERVFYKENVFENSPLGRTMAIYQEGNSFAKVAGNKPITFSYNTNSISDAVAIWKVNQGAVMPVRTGVYEAGELQKIVATDQDNKQVIEFKDKENRIILKKVQISATPSSGHDGWLCTYYVYDDFNNLRHVIPPLAVQKIATTWNVSLVADELCYQYTYDGRKRMITRKLPGVLAEEMVYDTRDRLVFKRNGKLLADKQWLVTFYDHLDRPVETALYKSIHSREILQTHMNTVSGVTGSNSYDIPAIENLIVANNDRDLYQATKSVELLPGFVSNENQSMEISISTALPSESIKLQVSNPLPGIQQSDLIPLTFTFYDNYDYPGAKSFVDADITQPKANDNKYPLPIIKSTILDGVLTGTKTKVLGTEKWLTTTLYYDHSGNTIQMIADNNLGGINTTTFLYNFSGKLLSSYSRQNNTRSAKIPAFTRLLMNNYDDGGRLKDVRLRINDDVANERTLAALTYDELGQIIRKDLGVKSNGQVMEPLNYEYNLQGRLSSINKEYLNNIPGSHFAMAISYDNGFTSKTYNGNISGIKWKGWNNPDPRAYGYTYDPANRLTIADYSELSNGSNEWNPTTMNFSVPLISYDANGNITALNQWGMDGAKKDLIDQLTYRYKDNSNKLETISDASSVVTNLGDFKNGSNSGLDFDYDDNGNITKDLNRNVTNIRYNHLNLPEEITVAGKGTVKYQYDANGSKLQKSVIYNPDLGKAPVVTDYLSGSIFQDNELKSIAHTEGRIRIKYPDGQPPAFVFDYFVKDYMGNTRLVLTEENTQAKYAATMESSSAATEEILFSNVSDTRVNKPVGYPDNNPENKAVSKLNAAGTGKKVGTSIVLRVMAGDTIKIGTQAFYKSNGPKSASDVTPENILADLLHSLNGAVSSGNNTHGVITTTAGPINSNFYNNDYQRLKKNCTDPIASDRPKAYLNYVLFDDQFKLVEQNSGLKQVAAAADELQTLGSEIAGIERSGFLYIYTSNESGQDVYFDNLVVTQSSGKVIEETHYYPFGLTMAGISAEALLGTNYIANKFRFSENELQNNEFTDGSGLELYNFGARTYDPQTGRFLQMDAFADSLEQRSFTPYHYAYNNPVYYIDKDGNIGLVGAAIGGGIGLVSYLTKSVIQNGWGSLKQEKTWGKALLYAGAGAIVGATGGLGSGMAATALTSFTASIAEDKIDGNKIDLQKAAFTSAVSTIGFGVGAYASKQLSLDMARHWWNRGNTNAFVRWLGNNPATNSGIVVSRVMDGAMMGAALGIDKLFPVQPQSGTDKNIPIQVINLPTVEITAQRIDVNAIITSDEEMQKARDAIKSNFNYLPYAQ